MTRATANIIHIPERRVHAIVEDVDASDHDLQPSQLRIRLYRSSWFSIEFTEFNYQLTVPSPINPPLNGSSIEFDRNESSVERRVHAIQLARIDRQLNATINRTSH